VLGLEGKYEDLELVYAKLEDLKELNILIHNKFATGSAMEILRGDIYNKADKSTLDDFNEEMTQSMKDITKLEKDLNATNKTHNQLKTFFE
jgi:hypothetical protein